MNRSESEEGRSPSSARTTGQRISVQALRRFPRLLQILRLLLRHQRRRRRHPSSHRRHRRHRRRHRRRRPHHGRRRRCPPSHRRPFLRLQGRLRLPLPTPCIRPLRRGHPFRLSCRLTPRLMEPHLGLSSRLRRQPVGSRNPTRLGRRRSFRQRPSSNRRPRLAQRFRFARQRPQHRRCRCIPGRSMRTSGSILTRYRTTV